MSREIDFQDYNGVAVKVDEYGNFVAQVNGLFVRDVTYDGLRTRIEAELKAEARTAKLDLACHVLLVDEAVGFSTASLTLIGLSRTDGRMRWKGHDGSGIQFALPATEENKVLLQDLAAAENARRQITEAIKARKIEDTRWGGRIQPSEYAPKLQRLQERYSEAMRQSIKLEVA